MREFASKSFVTQISIALIFLLQTSLALAEYVPYRTALVETFIDHQKITAISDREDWDVGEILPVISKNAKLGVIGFVEVNSVRVVGFKKFEIRLRLLRQSRKYFIQSGDLIRRMDLAAPNSDYIGSTDLLIRQSSMNVSSQYRPLVYQGFVIGDTAQPLFKGEFLVNYFGNVLYGYNEWLTLGTLAPVNVLGQPNLNFKARVYESEATTLATGLSYVRFVQKNQASLNLNFYWDTISSDSVVTHTFLGLGLISWEDSVNATAIKALSSSSFQTGYEIILDNWDRFLVGPNYNFEKKGLGGYLSYVWTMNRLHVQVSVNATDITHLRLDPTDGYYGFAEVYWRF
jgi:hypothetical protein